MKHFYEVRRYSTDNPNPSNYEVVGYEELAPDEVPARQKKDPQERVYRADPPSVKKRHCFFCKQEIPDRTEVQESKNEAG